MKISKICALVLALAMILPFVVSCGSTQEGTPFTFSSVTISSTYDPAAEPVEDAAEEPAEEGETAADEPAAPASSDYEEIIYTGEVVVYKVDETEDITMQDVLKAYADAQNENLVIDNGRVTKIGELGAGGGYFWNFQVNGKDAGLSTVVTPEDEIQITFTK